jgi:hypothetical protein
MSGAIGRAERMCAAGGSSALLEARSFADQHRLAAKFDRLVDTFDVYAADQSEPVSKALLAAAWQLRLGIARPYVLAGGAPGQTDEVRRGFGRVIATCDDAAILPHLLTLASGEIPDTTDDDVTAVFDAMQTAGEIRRLLLLSCSPAAPPRTREWISRRTASLRELLFTITRRFDADHAPLLSTLGNSAWNDLLADLLATTRIAIAQGDNE